MKEIVLSKRMEAVVSMVSPQSFAIADVGCDHAYVSIALMQRKMANKVIAMDVRKGPLSIAGNNVSQYGFDEGVELRLGDGLKPLRPGEADTIIIAGMGGLLIQSILEKGRPVWYGQEGAPAFILQPQSDIEQVRRYLYENGYCIVKEHMLIEEGKYYTVMRAEPGREEESRWKPEQWRYGAYNLERRDDVLWKYLDKEQSALCGIEENLRKVVEMASETGDVVSDKTKERLCEVRKKLQINRQARACYEQTKK